jgi:arylsulfatase A-like enzyme
VTAKRPNILMIVCDDLNAWIGALGRHPQVKTPAIDALAARGTLFTKAYCNAPYCNASRISALTGRLPSTTGVYEQEPFWSDPDRPTTCVEALRSHGYYAFGAGKVFHGKFDYRAATREAATSADWRDTQHRAAIWDDFRPLKPEPLPANRPLNRLVDFDNFADVSSKYYLFDWGAFPDSIEDQMPDSITASAVEEFLSAPPKEPFFCAAGIYKPHLPWHVPQRFFHLYPLRDIVLPLVKEDDLDDVPPIAREWALNPADHELVTSHGQWHHAVQGYLAAISYCDHIVGRIIDALQRSPDRDNTIIVLWGDNGFHLGEKLHWRKFALWEEATRVPLIIVPPSGTKCPPRISQPVSLVDLMPTLMDLLGLPKSNEDDGTSLAGLMSATAAGESGPPCAISTWGRGNHSVRRGHWRLTRYSDGTHELYDHSADAYEWTNLAADPRFSAKIRQLEAFLPKD